jgi:hypothetical protein
MTATSPDGEDPSMDEREREIVELRRQISELTAKLSALEALKAENAYLRRDRSAKPGGGAGRRV